MSFNPGKCNVMHVSKKKKPILHTYMRKSAPLTVVNKDLGWQSQVSKVSSKVNRTLGFVKRSTVTSAPSIKRKGIQGYCQTNTGLYSNCVGPTPTVPEEGLRKSPTKSSQICL